MLERRRSGYVWVRLMVTMLLVGAVLTTLMVPFGIILFWRSGDPGEAFKVLWTGAIAVFALLVVAEVLRLLLDIEDRLGRLERGQGVEARETEEQGG